MLKVLLHGQIGLWRTQRKRLLLAVIQTKLFKIAMSFSNLHGTWHSHLTFLQSLLSLCMMTQDVTRNLFRSNARLLRWSGWNVSGGNSKIPLRNGSFRVTSCNLYHLQSWCHVCTLFNRRWDENWVEKMLKSIQWTKSSKHWGHQHLQLCNGRNGHQQFAWSWLWQIAQLQKETEFFVGNSGDKQKNSDCLKKNYQGWCVGVLDEEPKKKCKRRTLPRMGHLGKTRSSEVQDRHLDNVMKLENVHYIIHNIPCVVVWYRFSNLSFWDYRMNSVSVFSCPRKLLRWRRSYGCTSWTCSSLKCASWCVFT